MKCPTCHNDMMKSTTGWLCLNCGIALPADAKAAPAESAKNQTPADKPAGPDKAQAAPPEPAASPVPEPAPAPAPVAAPVPPAPAPAPEASATSPVMPAPAPMPVPTAPAPAGGVSVGMVNTQPPRPRIGKKAGIIIGAAVVVVGLGGGAAYAAFVAPKSAPASYLNKVVSAKTAKFAGTVSFSGSGDTISLALKGAYDLKDQSNPKVDVSVSGSVAGTDFTSASSIKAEIKNLNKTVYFKLDSIDFLSDFLPVSISKDWYFYKYSDQPQVHDCATNSKGSGSFLGSQVITDLPVKNASRVGLFENVAGHTTTHYRGEVDTSKLQAAIDKANKGLSADCKITISAADYKNTTFNYDIWDSSGFDRITMVANDTKDKSKVTITLDTSDYNKPVSITAPTGAKDFSELLKNIFGASDQSFSDSSADSSSTSAKGRDAQRMSDLRYIRNALETYFNDNNEYPSVSVKPVIVATDAKISAVLVPNYMSSIPDDPSGGSAHYYYTCTQVSAGACNGYKLTATMEDPSGQPQYSADMGSGILPGTHTYELDGLD